MKDGLSEKKMIGQLLVQEGLIDERQLQWALSEQAQQRLYRPLGEILVGRGFISRRVFHEVLARYRKQILLGDLLVKMKVITEQQLIQSLEIQGRSAKRLGQILVERGLVNRSQLVDAICVQLGIEGMDGGMEHVDRALLENVNAVFLRKRRVIPLKFSNNRQVLTVLMEDPTDKETIADLGKIFKADIEAVMFREGDFDYLLEATLDIWSSSR